MGVFQQPLLRFRSGPLHGTGGSSDPASIDGKFTGGDEQQPFFAQITRPQELSSQAFGDDLQAKRAESERRRLLAS